MNRNNKRVVPAVTRPLGFVLMLLLMGWATPAQAQLQVAADIQVGGGDRQLSETTSVAASQGDQVVIEVFASGISESVGFNAAFQLSDPSVVTDPKSNNSGGPYEFPLTSIIDGNRVELSVGALQSRPTIPSGTPQYVGSLTLTMGQVTTLTITMISADPGTGSIPQNISFTVGDPNNLPIIGSGVADLNANFGNQGQTDARVNPGRLFPIEIYSNGLREITSYEIQLQLDDLSNFDAEKAHFNATLPFTVTAVSGSGGALPTAMPSNTPRAAIDIANGVRGDNSYNAQNLSVSAVPNAPIAIELYGAGYQDVAGFTAIFELSNPGAVQRITMNQGSAFPLKLGEPTLEGNVVTANLGFLGSTSATSPGLQYLGTIVILLNENVGNGLGITLKSLAFQTAESEDVLTPNAVLTAVGSGGSIISVGPTIEVNGNTLIAKATSRLPVSGSKLLGTFQILTSSTFRSGQITLSQITVSSNTKTETIEPNQVLNLGSIVSNVPTVLRPPIPITVTDTRAIIRWESDVSSTGKVLYGTSENNLSQEAETSSEGRIHTVRLSGLTLGTNYYFQVTNSDARGTSDPFPPRPARFRTSNRPDNQPPQILRGPGALSVLNTSAEIVFDTNEFAVAEVQYGASQNDLSTTASISVSDVLHKVLLDGLTPNTQYFYRVRVTDLSGNASTTTPKTFTTRSGVDTVPPRILGRPSVQGRSYNATAIEWLTDEASNSTIIYGTDAAELTETISVDESVRKHAISLGNLLAGVEYYYQVKSADASGNESTSPVFSFTTSSTEDTQAPRFVRPPIISNRTNTQVTIRFRTDEYTNATVQYHTTTDVYDDETGTVGETVNASDSATDHEITITNLEARTRYYYKVSVTDLVSNGPTTNPGRRQFATTAFADTRPPVIFSRPIADGITSGGAVIRWGADEPHSAIIRFGPVVAGKQTTSTDLTETVEDLNVESKHDVTLADLTAGTTYAYEVETIDGSGNSSTSTGLEFTTAAGEDSAPPVIINGPVVRNITATTATIDWTTDEISDSRVAWGTSTEYTDAIEDATGTRIHSATLTNLEAGTIYHYAVGSADQSGNVVTTNATGTIIGLSKDHTFRTLASEDTEAPVITEGPIVEFTDQIAVVTWRTDELATSRVTMGVPSTSSNITDTTPVFGETSELIFESNELVTHHAVTVTGLSAGLNYVYQASSTDASGNTVNSSTPSSASTKQVPGGFGSFTTSTESDTQFPVITSGPTVVSSTSSTLMIEWETDESANSDVIYGTSSDSLGDQKISNANLTSHRVVLTKLAAGTTYAYEVASTDATGNGATRSKIAYGTTASKQDLTAPVITTAPTVIYKNDRSATIQWITNESANAQIAYGTSADSLVNVKTSPDFETEHNVTLTNLSASTTYHFKASSTDQDNNGPASSSVISFTTESAPDTQNPTISAVSSTVADSSAIISWTTDEVSDSAVRYGTTSGSYDLNAGDATDVTAHKVTLTNLQPNTTYFYVVESIDRSGNGPAQSTEGTFSTTEAGSVQAPAPPTGLIVSGGNGAVKLFWAASPSSGVVGYTIERAANSGTFAPLASIDPTTSYVDKNVTNGTPYSYRVSTVGLKQLTSTASTASETVTPSEDGGPSVPTLFGIQGNQLTPTIVINNSTPLNANDVLSYTFHLATSADFTDALALEAGLSDGAGTGAGDPTTVTAFTVPRTLTDGTTYHYRVKASDGTFDSAYLTGTFTADADAPEFPGDLTGDKSVGFPDFLSFLGTFNATSTDDNFIADADLNGDGSVGFPDFLAFLGVFNKQYINGSGNSGKPVVQIVYGQNTEAQFQLTGRHLKVGDTNQDIAVDIKLKNATDLKGYGIRITYDPSAIQFINASDKGETFLKTDNRQAEIFGVLDHDAGNGEVFIASGITHGDPVEGEGVLATLQFRVLGNDPQNALIEIAQGLLIDGGLNPSIAQNLGDRFAQMPTEYALEHNFPNPFNPETTLRYAIPQAGDVTLIVYNVLGQEITRLVDAKQTPGFYAVRWNGQDALGRSVASGVYLYRIQAGDFNKTHKMLLLK